MGGLPEEKPKQLQREEPSWRKRRPISQSPRKLTPKEPATTENVSQQLDD